MKELCEKKVEELEAAKQKALAKHASGEMTKAEWDKFLLDNNRRTVSLKSYTNSINTHLEAHERVGEAGKWKHVGR